MDEFYPELKVRVGIPSDIMDPGDSPQSPSGRNTCIASDCSKQHKVKVYVRMRPFREFEKVCPLKQVLCLIGETIVVRDLDHPLMGNSKEHPHKAEKIEFKVDYMQDDSYLQVNSEIHKAESQQRMYGVLGVPCLESALDGYNTTVLAYGQTGSGKTYTMLGDRTKAGRGLIPRLANDLMTKIKEESTNGILYTVQVSYLEIYQEKILDLLADLEEDDVEENSKRVLHSLSSPVGSNGDDGMYSHGNSLQDKVITTYGGSLIKNSYTSSFLNKTALYRQLEADHMQGRGISHNGISPLERPSATPSRQGRSNKPKSPKMKPAFETVFSKQSVHNQTISTVMEEEVRHSKQNFLKIREHPVTGPFVEGLLWKDVYSCSDMENLLRQGSKSRTTASTDMNDQSSRSHAIFSIRLTRTLQPDFFGVQPRKVSYINLVDLAGSEKLPKLCSGAVTGQRTQEESRCINRSLSQLNEVILSLSRSCFVSYRNSVLTWLLKESLGGNSRTFMVANISPTEKDLRESINTLRYVTTASRVQPPEIADLDAKSKLIRKLREEIGTLRAVLLSFTSAKDNAPSHQNPSMQGFKVPCLDVGLQVEYRCSSYDGTHELREHLDRGSQTDGGRQTFVKRTDSIVASEFQVTPKDSGGSVNYNQTFLMESAKATAYQQNLMLHICGCDFGSQVTPQDFGILNAGHQVTSRDLGVVDVSQQTTPENYNNNDICFPGIQKHQDNVNVSQQNSSHQIALRRWQHIDDGRQTCSRAYRVVDDWDQTAMRNSGKVDIEHQIRWTDFWSLSAAKISSDVVVGQQTTCTQFDSVDIRNQTALRDSKEDDVGQEKSGQVHPAAQRDRRECQERNVFHQSKFQLQEFPEKECSNIAQLVAGSQIGYRELRTSDFGHQDTLQICSLVDKEDQVNWGSASQTEHMNRDCRQSITEDNLDDFNKVRKGRLNHCDVDKSILQITSRDMNLVHIKEADRRKLCSLNIDVQPKSKYDDQKLPMEKPINGRCGLTCNCSGHDSNVLESASKTKMESVGVLDGDQQQTAPKLVQISGKGATTDRKALETSGDLINPWITEDEQECERPSFGAVDDSVPTSCDSAQEADTRKRDHGADISSAPDCENTTTRKQFGSGPAGIQLILRKANSDYRLRTRLPDIAAQDASPLPYWKDAHVETTASERSFHAVSDRILVPSMRYAENDNHTLQPCQPGTTDCSSEILLGRIEAADDSRRKLQPKHILSRNAGCQSLPSEFGVVASSSQPASNARADQERKDQFNSSCQFGSGVQARFEFGCQADLKDHRTVSLLHRCTSTDFEPVAAGQQLSLSSNEATEAWESSRYSVFGAPPENSFADQSTTTAMRVISSNARLLTKRIDCDIAGLLSVRQIPRITLGTTSGADPPKLLTFEQKGQTGLHPRYLYRKHTEAFKVCNSGDLELVRSSINTGAVIADPHILREEDDTVLAGCLRCEQDYVLQKWQKQAGPEARPNCLDLRCRYQNRRDDGKELAINKWRHEDCPRVARTTHPQDLASSHIAAPPKNILSDLTLSRTESETAAFKIDKDSTWNDSGGRDEDSQVYLAEFELPCLREGTSHLQHTECQLEDNSGIQTFPGPSRNLDTVQPGWQRWKNIELGHQEDSCNSDIQNSQLVNRRGEGDPAPGPVPAIQSITDHSVEDYVQQTKLQSPRSRMQAERLQIPEGDSNCEHLRQGADGGRFCLLSDIKRKNYDFCKIALQEEAFHLCCLWTLAKLRSRVETFSLRRPPTSRVRLATISPTAEVAIQVDLCSKENCKAPGTDLSTLCLHVFFIFVVFRMAAPDKVSPRKGRPVQLVKRFPFLAVPEDVQVLNCLPDAAATRAVSFRHGEDRPPQKCSTQLQSYRVEPEIFNATTPFFIQTSGECSQTETRSNRSLPSSDPQTCPGYNISCEVKTHRLIHFLKEGVNSLGSNKGAHIYVEGLSENHAEFIHMPGKRCVQRKGYVVARLVAPEAMAFLNGQPMLEHKQLQSGDVLVLRDVRCLSSVCTLHFFDLLQISC